MPKINTYTDNATIEDVDAVLTYDPSGSGATKLTTFARIASWVSAKLAALGKKTAITSADQILMVNGSAAARIDYNVLAKAIIEQYAGSTVAGSAQSVKAALDALNSNVNSFGTATDLNEATKSKVLYRFNSGAENNPGYNYGFLIAFTEGNNVNQFAIPRGGAGTTAESISRRSKGANGGWGEWVKFPSRAELTALEARVTALENK